MTDKIKSIVIDCKYYLPCGRCDKTNGFCSQLDEIGVQPTSFVLPTEYTTSTSAGEVEKNDIIANEVMPEAQFIDVDVQMRIIKGDLRYLSEKIDKLSSFIEEQKIKR